VLAGAVIALIVGETSFIIFLLLRRSVRRRAKRILEERLRFETLLSELTAGLIHVGLDGIDAALQRGLRQVVAALGVDRGQLVEYPKGRRESRVSSTLAGVEAPLPVMEADQFPWTAETLKRGEIVRFSRIDELPPAASVDRESYRQVGTRSHVSLPLRASGPVLGVLSFDASHDERTWPDDLVERLRLLSQAFASALERKRVELSLAESLSLEKLLSSLSTAFSHLSSGDFDQEIQRGLREVVDFLGVDRGSLIEFSRDGGTARSWAIEEWMDVGEFPWMTARLRRGDVVSFSQLEELPDEAAVDRQSYLTHRVKPQVAVPLLASGVVVGGLVFSTVGPERAASAELVQQLHLLGEVFANVLSRKQGELEARRLRQELTHVGRVSAMGELTASLAHELGQPLTAILSNAQAAQGLLARDVMDLETVREILKDIVEDDKRAAAVIRRFRVLLKKGDLEEVSLAVNDVVNEVVWLLKNDALIRNVSMSLDLAADLPPVRGDRVQLQQVVLNLVLNGLEAMREASERERTLVIRTGMDGAATITVSVRDSGTGIDERNSERMFQPLYTTKVEGLGMGLAISRTIVEAHGGRLSASNNPDGGATFHFRFPVAPEDAR
jgi:signal transduction histidine kinase